MKEHELPPSIRNHSSTQDSDWMRTTPEGVVYIKAENGEWEKIVPHDPPQPPKVM